MPSIRNLIDFYDNDDEILTKSSSLLSNASTHDLGDRRRQILRYMRTKSSPIGLSLQSLERDNYNGDWDQNDVVFPQKKFSSNVQRLRGIFSSKTSTDKERQARDEKPENVVEKNQTLKKSAINVNVDSYVNLHSSQPIYIPNINTFNGHSTTSNTVYRSTLSLTNREKTASNKSLNKVDNTTQTAFPSSTNFEIISPAPNRYGEIETKQAVKNIPISKTQMLIPNSDVKRVPSMNKFSDFISPPMQNDSGKQQIDRTVDQNLEMNGSGRNSSRYMQHLQSQNVSDKLKLELPTGTKSKRRFRRKSIKRSKSIDLSYLRPLPLRMESSLSSSDSEKGPETMRSSRCKTATKRELYRYMNTYDSDDSICGIPKPMHNLAFF